MDSNFIGVGRDKQVDKVTMYGTNQFFDDNKLVQREMVE